MKYQIIITADDYGMCDSVNEAIEECLAAGAMRATCVMTNMPACDAAATLRTRFPQASIGIHWTLTQGKPLSPANQVTSLVDIDGQFLSFETLRRRLLAGKIDTNQLRVELLAQYRRFRELAGEPDFWNTHQNVHVSPGLFKTFVEVGRELGIPAMRCHRRVTVPRQETAARYHLRHPLYWVKGQIIAWWSAKAEAKGVLMPQGIITLPGFGAGKAAVEEAITRVEWGGVRKAIELVIHPATTVDVKLFGALTESRLSEYKVFSDPALKSRLSSGGVETVGFEVLRHG